MTCRCGNPEFGTCRRCSATFCRHHAAGVVDRAADTLTPVADLCRECGRAELDERAAEAQRAREFNERERAVAAPRDERPVVATPEELAEYILSAKARTGAFGAPVTPTHRLDGVTAELFGAGVVLAMRRVSKTNSYVHENRPRRWWHRLGANVQPTGARRGWGTNRSGWYVTPQGDVFRAEPDGPGAIIKIRAQVAPDEIIPEHWVLAAASLTLPRPSR